MIKVYERRMKVSEISKNPDEFNALTVGSFFNVEDKDYIIVDIIRYFYNFLSDEIVLNLLIQEIDFSKDISVDTREELLDIIEGGTRIVSEKKIEKNANHLDKDINNITVGSVFKSTNKDLYKIVSINQIKYDNDSLFIYFSANKIIPLSTDFLMKEKQKSMKKQFTVHNQ